MEFVLWVIFVAVMIGNCLMFPILFKTLGNVGRPPPAPPAVRGGK